MTDLDQMLSELTVSRRPGRWTVVSTDRPVVVSGEVAAVLAEPEGFTVVATMAEAERQGWGYHFEAAWLTLDIHSSLDAVGLTAAVSRALAEHGIACNVLAGYYHDHLLIPVHRADEAVNAITQLAER